jgi:hypothetical protein
LDKNIPFYIGIGTDKNHYRARQTALGRNRRRNTVWERIAAKTEYEVEILLDDLTVEEAMRKEKEFIVLYGRLDKGTGTLANLTDGGEGANGTICSEERKALYAKLFTGRKHTEEVKKRISEVKKGVKKSEGHKQKLREANLGKKYSDETKAKLSKIHKGNKYCLGHKHSKETLDKMSKVKMGHPPTNFGPKDHLKKTYSFIDPDGKICNIKGLVEFCKELKLSISMMCQVHSGKSASHKGWVKNVVI